MYSTGPQGVLKWHSNFEHNFKLDCPNVIICRHPVCFSQLGLIANTTYLHQCCQFLLLRQFGNTLSHLIHSHVYLGFFFLFILIKPWKKQIHWIRLSKIWISHSLRLGDLLCIHLFVHTRHVGNKFPKSSGIGDVKIFMSNQLIRSHN